MAKTPATDNRFYVKGEDKPRGNFTMVPNILSEIGLSPGAFLLRFNLEKLAGQSPEKILSSARDIARSTGMPIASVRRHLKELQEAGLVYFAVEATEQRLSDSPTVRTLILRDVWPFNYGYHHKQKGLRTLAEVVAALRPGQIGPAEVGQFGPEKVGQIGPLKKDTCSTKKDRREDTHRHLSRPTATALKADGDDGFNIASAFAEESDNGTRGLVRQWFNKLSNGAAWRETRDGLGFVDVIQCRPGIILMGMCWSIAKSPQHRISSFKYCVNAILQYHKDLNDVPDDVLEQMAESEYRKALFCLRSGKWMVSDFDMAEWEQFKEQKRGATVRHPRQS